MNNGGRGFLLYAWDGWWNIDWRGVVTGEIGWWDIDWRGVVAEEVGCDRGGRGGYDHMGMGGVNVPVGWVYRY